ncbi:nucleotide exchange factor GrpE [Thermithiobacillus plumbiphilus]|uniref:Protein GrpE n=1 Tax=Thermithiobacillus plumbiphilus TaxID=1729899 RepID=A0ABU9D9A8_9PROT
MTDVNETAGQEQMPNEDAGNAAIDWEEKARENWEQFLRTRAELENIQKRNQRQLEDAHKYAIERFARELLPVRDSLEMALASESNAGNAEQLREGVQMTLNMLTQAFEKFGIQLIDPEGERFDPNRHQAIAAVEDEGEPNRVLQVHQKGYSISDRLLRPAMVSVSKAAGNPG